MEVTEELLKRYRISKVTGKGLSLEELDALLEHYGLLVRLLIVHCDLYKLVYLDTLDELRFLHKMKEGMEK